MNNTLNIIHMCGWAAAFILMFLIFIFALTAFQNWRDKKKVVLNAKVFKSVDEYKAIFPKMKIE